MKQIDKISNKLVKAFLRNQLINSIPNKFVKNINLAQDLRRLCESKIKKPIIGFKAAGTGFPVLKKLGEKEPFYASVYKHNFLKSGKKVKINKFTMGVELEVCYLIKKSFFSYKKHISMKNIDKFITHMAPCIEVVGYRQRKKGITFLGDLCSDFGANVKFLIGVKKKFKKINIGNLNTKIYNTRLNHFVEGNTNTVYINPLNSLRFVLNKLRKDKTKLNTSFYVFTGSTVGVVPIKGNGIYKGFIDKLGSASVKIIK